VRVFIIFILHCNINIAAHHAYHKLLLLLGKILFGADLSRYRV
jgi:hypothetical protein